MPKLTRLFDEQNYPVIERALRKRPFGFFGVDEELRRRCHDELGLLDTDVLRIVREGKIDRHKRDNGVRFRIVGSPPAGVVRQGRYVHVWVERRGPELFVVDVEWAR